MSTVEHPEPRTFPPLVDGERMDQPAFHERYAAMGEGKWFELVGGVVHMVYPAYEDHGLGDSKTIGWLFHYWRFTPGVRAVNNVSTILGDACEVQPDSQLRILEEYGGRARVEGGYIVGPPELVIEVGRSSRRLDLGGKKADYERAGVPEYLFEGSNPGDVHWFRLLEGRYVEIEPDAGGVLRSEVFPGLWLDPKALFEDDPNGLIEALERGLASPEHQEFVAILAARKAGG